MNIVSEFNRLKKYFQNLKKHNIEECSEARLAMLTSKRKGAIPVCNFEPVKSAVLIIFTVYSEKISILLIQRATDLSVHSGQIAFPGGRFDNDKEDSDTMDTAIRETFEETGVLAKRSDVLCRLKSLYIQASNYIVDPFIVFIENIPCVNLNMKEVDKILFIPVADLLNAEIIQENTFNTNYGQAFSPCFSISDIKIWGATAMLLSELTCLLDKYQAQIQF